jgi:hypothetical protein
MIFCFLALKAWFKVPSSIHKPVPNHMNRVVFRDLCNSVGV